MTKETIGEILEGAELPRPAVSLVEAPLSTTPAEFYDILLDRWRAGERSPALADAIRRGINGFSWIQVLFVDDTSMSAIDWGDGERYQPNGSEWKSCRVHGHVFSIVSEVCPECKGGKDKSEEQPVQA